MTKLHTLTVPDMLWINLQMTGASVPYSFARLEEAVFAQYGHGQSRDVPAQAANFLRSFARMRPFGQGNDACAFVGCLTFLAMNGHSVKLGDSEAAAWVRNVWANPETALDQLASRLQPAEGHHELEPDHHEAARSVMDGYPDTLADLVKNEAPVPIA